MKHELDFIYTEIKHQLFSNFVCVCVLFSCKYVQHSIIMFGVCHIERKNALSHTDERAFELKNLPEIERKFRKAQQKLVFFILNVYSRCDLCFSCAQVHPLDVMCM